MTIPWYGDFQIKFSSGSPQTSQGPALAALGNTLMMVYVARGGKTLWSCSVDSTKGFTTWEANQKVSLPGQPAMSASFRPSLAVLNGVLHMVYTGASDFFLYWAWFDGESWQGNVQLSFGGFNVQPTLAAHNGLLYLAYHIGDPIPWELLTLPTPSTKHAIAYSKYDPQMRMVKESWQFPTVLSYFGHFPSIASFDGNPQLFFPETNGNKIFQMQMLNGIWTASNVLGTNNLAPMTSGGLAVVPVDATPTLLYMMFPRKGSSRLAYAILDATGEISDVTAIQTDDTNSQPKTSAPPAAALCNDMICLAYKSESNNRIYFSYAPADFP